MTQNTLLLCLVAFSSACIVVLGATPVVRYWGLQSGKLDRPDARKIHKQPIVRLGGIAMFVGVMAALAIVALAGGESALTRESDWSILGVLMGAIAFFSLGLADDFLGLTASLRLLVQFGVASLAWGLGVRIAVPFLPADTPIALLLSLLVTIVWLVGVVNAINWIDGLDGLAAGVSGISALSISVVALAGGRPAIALFALALAGSTLGFLRYNFNPATIFMGDGGSYFLGFGLASLCVLEFATQSNPGQLLPFAILAVPIFDMTAVILARLQDGQSPFTPDKRHLHHRLLGMGASQRASAIYVYGLTLLGGSSAIALAGLGWGRWVAAASGALAIALSWQLYQQQIPKQES